MKKINKKSKQSKCKFLELLGHSIFEEVTKFLVSRKDVLSLFLLCNDIYNTLSKSPSAFRNVIFVVGMEKPPRKTKKICFVRNLKIVVSGSGKKFSLLNLVKKFTNTDSLEISHSFRSIPRNIFQYLPKSRITKLDLYNSIIGVNNNNNNLVKYFSKIEYFIFGGENHSNEYFYLIQNLLNSMTNLKIMEVVNCDFSGNNLSGINISQNKMIKKMKLSNCFDLKFTNLNNIYLTSTSLELEFNNCQFHRDFNLHQFTSSLYSSSNITNDRKIQVSIKGVSCRCTDDEDDIICEYQNNNNSNNISLHQCNNCNGELFLTCQKCNQNNVNNCQFCNIIDPTILKESECLHELHVPRTASGSGIHQNLVNYFRKNLQGIIPSVSVSPSGEGIYLLFPEVCDESRNTLKSTLIDSRRPNVTDEIVERILYSLCETACIVTAVALSSSSSSSGIIYNDNKESLLENVHKELVESFQKCTPSQQVLKILEPVRSANILTVPCGISDMGGQGWPASKKLWNSPYIISKGIIGISEIILEQQQQQQTSFLRNINDLEREHIYVGHKNFMGFEFVKTALRILEKEEEEIFDDVTVKKKKRSSALIPMRVRNFLQDQKRYESHLIGILVFSDKSVVLVDPNGIPNFEPNALLLKVPWENKRKRKER